jgi:sensor c-di-GMP phosphodiesterase-like protein
MKTHFILVIAALAMLIACGEQNQNNKQKEERETSTAKEHSHAKETELQLNKGQKWQANPATTKGINKMQSILTEYSALDQLDACYSLKDSLETTFNGIIQECTMKGEAHEQLHHYLFPMKKQFKALGSDKLDSCQVAYQRLDKHLNMYSDYFK